MNRRALLLGGASLTAIPRARAQPMPTIGPVGGQPQTGGPSWSLEPPGKTLDLSFMAAGTLDPRITFTRGSTATYFDVTGTMQTTRTNLLLWSTDFTNATWAVFNGATKGAVIAGPDGTMTAITLNFAATTDSEMYQTISGYPAGTTLSIWARARASNQFALRFAADGDSVPFNLTSQWQRFSYVTVSGGNANAGVVNVGGTAGSIDIAMPQLEAGTPASFYIPTTSASNGAPRWDYDPVTHVLRGLLIEESRTNLLLNSATLSTQSVTTTAVATTLSFYGTGSVTLSGTSSGTTNGTGAATRVSTTFTPTAGTLTLTVSGSVTNAQVEAGAFPTSYIPTTGAAVTRAADTATIASIPGRNATTESYQAEFILLARTAGSNPHIVADSASTRTPLFVASLLTGGSNDAAGNLLTANALTGGVVTKLASNWATPNAGRACLNAGTVAGVTTQTNGFGSITSFKFMGDSVVADQATGYIRRFRYWPRVLTDTELQQVTT